jgi:hypothetical protein
MACSPRRPPLASSFRDGGAKYGPIIIELRARRALLNRAEAHAYSQCRRWRGLVDVGFPATADYGVYRSMYDWNLLPIGQLLWLKELTRYVKYPPLQDPASYNLDQVLQDEGGTREGSARPAG